jgi:hypothetical protein
VLRGELPAVDFEGIADRFLVAPLAAWTLATGVLAVVCVLAAECELFARTCAAGARWTGCETNSEC